MSWKLVYTKQAQKDAQKLAAGKQNSCSTFWPRTHSKTLPPTKNSSATWLEPTRDGLISSIGWSTKFLKKSAQ